MTKQELAERMNKLREDLADLYDPFCVDCKYYETCHFEPVKPTKQFCMADIDTIIALLKSHGMVFVSKNQEWPDIAYPLTYVDSMKLRSDGFRRVLLP